MLLWMRSKGLSLTIVSATVALLQTFLTGIHRVRLHRSSNRCYPCPKRKTLSPIVFVHGDAQAALRRQTRFRRRRARHACHGESVDVDRRHCQLAAAQGIRAVRLLCPAYFVTGYSLRRVGIEVNE